LGSHVNTRWFKYDRDKLWLVYTQIVPVIFEPPCTVKKAEAFQAVLKDAGSEINAEKTVHMFVSDQQNI
jgi:hypothetical protein